MGNTNSANTAAAPTPDRARQAQHLANTAANQSPYHNTNEPAECTACTDKPRTSRQINGTSVNGSDDNSSEECLAYSHSGCPLSRAEVGRAAWAYLHTVAAYYPAQPTPRQQQRMTDYMQNMSYTYPCNYCADETVKHVSKPGNDVSHHIQNRESLSLWLCDVHNEVNQRLGKRMFDCRYVLERWRTGPPDGSCD